MHYHLNLNERLPYSYGFMISMNLLYLKCWTFNLKFLWLPAVCKKMSLGHLVFVYSNQCIHAFKYIYTLKNKQTKAALNELFTYSPPKATSNAVNCSEFFWNCPQVAATFNSSNSFFFPHRKYLCCSWMIPSPLRAPYLPPFGIVELLPLCGFKELFQGDESVSVCVHL